MLPLPRHLGNISRPSAGRLLLKRLSARQQFAQNGTRGARFIPREFTAQGGLAIGAGVANQTTLAIFNAGDFTNGEFPFWLQKIGFFVTNTASPSTAVLSDILIEIRDSVGQTIIGERFRVPVSSLVDGATALNNRFGIFTLARPMYLPKNGWYWIRAENLRTTACTFYLTLVGVQDATKYEGVNRIGAGLGPTARAYGHPATGPVGR